MTEPSGRQGRPPAALLTAALLLALGLGWLGGSNAYRVLEFLYKPNQLPGDDGSCLTHPRSATELAEARSYLIQTASPSYTMAKQGVELAIERLHPQFAIRLTKALREARDYGLVTVIFSAYRPARHNALAWCCRHRLRTVLVRARSRASDKKRCPVDGWACRLRDPRG